MVYARNHIRKYIQQISNLPLRSLARFYLDLLCNEIIESITSTRKTHEPSIESAMATSTFSQNFPYTPHTLFHRKCELPCTPRRPKSIAAPTVEKRSATMIRSPIAIGMARLRDFLLAPANNEATSEKAEYMHTITFATTKYLQLM